MRIIVNARARTLISRQERQSVRAERQVLRQTKNIAVECVFRPPAPPHPDLRARAWQATSVCRHAPYQPSQAALPRPFSSDCRVKGDGG